MKNIKMYRYYTLSESEAVIPRDGQCLVNRYWLVNDDGLLFYSCGELMPQSNKNEDIANMMLNQKTTERGDCKIKLIPIVYIGRDHSLKTRVKLVDL
jgi:hypothetical protein